MTPLGLNEFNLQPIEVLIVDDSKMARMSLGKILLSEKFHILAEAENGLAGLNIIKSLSKPPDIVITDVEMPRLDGYTMLKNATEFLTGTKKFVVTSHANPETLRMMMTIGIDGFLVKPFDRDTILQKIAKAFDRIEYLKK